MIHDFDPYKKLYPPPHICECGDCGLVTTPGKHFIIGHNTRQRNLTNNPMNNHETMKKATDSRRKNGTYERHSKRMKINNPMKNPETVEKRKRTWIRKYGVEHPSKNKEVSKRITDKNIRNGTYERLGRLNKERMKKWIKTEDGIEHVKNFVERTTDWDFFNEHGIKKSFFPYNEFFNIKTKKQIRNQWSNRCVITGMTNEEHKQIYGRSLHVHHWTYDKTTDDPYFLLPVVTPINEMANTEREEWMGIFGGIAETGVPLWKYYEEG